MTPSPLPARPARSEPTVARSPHLVAAVALVGYLLIFVVFALPTGDLRDFVLIGRQFVTKSDVSPVIKLDPTYRYADRSGGYDGQFAYFIALDPENARYYLDLPSYRYTRILYPAAARTVALGRPDWVPAGMVLVNLLAVVGGTWAVAAWCARRGLTPWWGLVYAFYVGQVIGFTRDLNEPLAYALVAVGIYLFDFAPRGWLWAAGTFALAGLARETTLVFPALYALRLAFGGGEGASLGRRFGKAGLFGGIALAPTLLWQLFLIGWLGSSGLRQGGGLVQWPFESLWNIYRGGTLRDTTLEVVEVVVVPGVVCLAVAAYYLWRWPHLRGRVELWALVVNTLLFVVLLPFGSMLDVFAAGRISTPVVMGAIYALAFVPRREWFYFCMGPWLVATVAYLINPVFAVLNRG